MPKPLRLLIAEDSEDDALLLVRNLRQADYAVSFERVAAPAALRDAITRENWDLVISDYNMPGFGGLDAEADDGAEVVAGGISGERGAGSMECREMCDRRSVACLGFRHLTPDS